jgi:hypothetical protein
MFFLFMLSLVLLYANHNLKNITSCPNLAETKHFRNGRS